MQKFSRPTKSHNLSMGIVGMPNVGKSTLFNLLTNSSVQAHNYPFCTIDPTDGRVSIPDPRLSHLSNIYTPKNTIPSYLNVTDIAGLVKGASTGLGLGNAFLDNIRTTDGIFHVVRCFEDNSVVHYDTTVDPTRDIITINDELRFKDLQLVNKILEKSIKNRNNLSKDKRVLFEHNTLVKIKDILEVCWLTECLNKGENDIDKGKSNISHKDINIGIIKDNTATNNTTSNINTINNNLIPSNFALSNDEVLFISTLNLLTTKPVVYLANISNEDYKNKKINKYLKSILHVKPIIFSLEGEGTKVFIDKMVRMGCSILDLITYFTVGKDEVRSWKIRNKTISPQAGSVIHTDFEKYFVSAEVFNHKDLHELGSEAEVRKKGKCYTKRKMYVVEMGVLYTLSLMLSKGEKVCVRVGV
ncbi:DUF933 domain-containing protein [Hamiltosporidium magnivora]|uniref:DUF933 domain-containing protein n=1 Tax=Hamiltosporidium magnivora TaxID=148818 RepID=A0A4Q9L9Y8_9MICR|nr:DUF933 domain-containing protein [Hamiltosporidium magnivora]